MQIRPFRPADADDARALFEIERTRHDYTTRSLELVDVVASSPDGDEYGALVATADGSRVVGVVLFGMVAGAVGTGMIHGVGAAEGWRHRGVGRALVEAACDALARAGARVAIAELADDAALADVHRLLERAGFREESRAPDLVRDGVAVVFRRRDLVGR